MKSELLAGTSPCRQRESLSLPAAQGDYLPALDGLRAVSIALVVISHLGLPHVVPGAFGVTLFFFISGALITRQLLASLARHGKIDFAGFYLRRVLRLAPAACCYILVAGCVYAAAGGRISLAGWLGALFYGANYLDLWGFYRSALPGVRHPFNILWSLAIEEHFYAVWPLALAFLWRRRAALAAILLLCAAAPLWRLWLLHLCFTPGAPEFCGPIATGAWRYNRLYLATDARLDSLAWGVAFALLAHVGRAPPRWLAWPGVALLAASFVGASPLARDVLRPTLQGAALLACFPALLASLGPLRAPAAIFIGRLSYSLYLWHWGALMLADMVAPRDTLTWIVCGAASSAALALISYLAIEQPMKRVRRHFGAAAR